MSRLMSFYRLHVSTAKTQTTLRFCIGWFELLVCANTRFTDILSELLIYVHVDVFNEKRIKKTLLHDILLSRFFPENLIPIH